MIPFLCWSLVYVARALLWLYLSANTAVFYGPIARWTTKPVKDWPGLRVHSRLGLVLVSPLAWANPASRFLVLLANRGLPALGGCAGELSRLYPRW